jgi:hypothetical protein
MTTDEMMYSIWECQNAEEPLCYCTSSENAYVVAEYIEARYPDIFVVEPGCLPDVKRFLPDATGLDNLKKKTNAYQSTL